MDDGAGTPVREIVTERLVLPVGAGTMTVHAARPAGSRPLPAVLVGFEMFGLTAYVTRVADRLARAGYLALVPDFYHRRSEDGSPLVLPADAAGRERGLALLATLRRGQVRDDLDAVVAHVERDAGANGRVAMVGLSAGGHIAFYAATQLPLAAVALFYPGWLTAAGTALSRPDPLLALAPRIAALGTPVLVLLGEADHLYSADDRAEISAALHDAGVRSEVVSYPDTPHGFFCDERDSYRPGPAADAWRRTLRLLRAELGPGG
jgi:carboxymethylenebutenolidase